MAEAIHKWSGRGVISVEGWETPIPVIYRDGVSLQAASSESSEDAIGILIIDQTPDVLAPLFARLASAEGTLRLYNGYHTDFRLFGRNSYDPAKDPALVVTIRLIETRVPVVR